MQSTIRQLCLQIIALIVTMKNKLLQPGAMITCLLALFLFCSCKKTTSSPQPPPPAIPGPFNVVKTTVNDSTISNNAVVYGLPSNVVLKIYFSAPVKTSTVADNVSFLQSGAPVAANYFYTNNDSVLIIQPSARLAPLSVYNLFILTGLQSTGDSSLGTKGTYTLFTSIDSSDKFPRVSDSALLDIVQKQTLTYFYDFGHPVSGMARERNDGNNDVVTTGGTGFGIMSMIAGANRNFITRTQALQRINTIVSFLKDKCTRFHGAFSHWINGSTGATIPFSTYDDGGDLVETSYMMQGLLCARQYFNNTSDATETQLRTNIDSLWNGVEWSWYRQGGQNALFWHWSPDYGFKINQQISGWDEALIVYALAASSNIDSIPKIVYDNGWALNGGIKNGNSYYGVQLPLGPALGGPLFFAHYSFLGINPNGLTDAYANYLTQNTNHTLINYNYCVANPKHYIGYSDSCWGLTASDDDTKGYDAHSPTDDDGVITPTAAISSLPYTPAQSMAALQFFYYTLGDKIFKQYGFMDAFNLQHLWYSGSYLAIDQGPEIVMIENYRSGLLWNLFMSCPEVKRGMKNLGFQSPNL